MAKFTTDDLRTVLVAAMMIADAEPCEHRCGPYVCNSCKVEYVIDAMRGLAQRKPNETD